MFFNKNSLSYEVAFAFFIRGYQILNPRYGVQVDTVQLIADGLKLRAIILFQTTKNPLHRCNGFLLIGAWR